MLPDDIIIEITKLLTIREYHRLSLTENISTGYYTRTFAFNIIFKDMIGFVKGGGLGLDLSTNLALGIVCVKDYSRL